MLLALPSMDANGDGLPAPKNFRRPALWSLRLALLVALAANVFFVYVPGPWNRPCAAIATCVHGDKVPVADDAVAPCPLPANETIPRIVHFVYGLKPDASIPFSFVNYLVIKAAYRNIRPTAILYHYVNLPDSKWFRHARRFLVLAPVKPFTEIYGNPVDHFAHRADIVRLRALQRYGGIYLDMDVLAIRPFDPLLSHDMVMAQEGEGGRIGLCNAVILARKNSLFIEKWMNSYRTFNQSDWNYHSVVLPGIMARNHPDLLTVLGHTRFFWPMWDPAAVHELFHGTWDFRENFGVHLWESKSWEGHLKDLTVRKIIEGTSPLYRILQSLIWDELDDLLRIESW